jgi:hypothetical protein
MKPIPEEIVRRTWLEVAGFSTLRANIEIMKIGKNQPELLAFMAESINKMDQEVNELGFSMFFVVYRIFQKAQGKIKKISTEEITECYEHNKILMEKLEECYGNFFNRVTNIEIFRQAHLFKYVVDSLMEEEEWEDALALTEEQKTFLFFLLKTVIDVLDPKCVES